MKRLLVLFAFLLSGGLAWAQPQQQVGIWPDCVQFYHFTLAGQVTSNFDNRQLGCTDWIVTYTASGFGAVTLITQSAVDAAGAPGAWGNYAGVVVTGVNPNIAITYATTVFSGYQPWMRMRLNAVAGVGNVWGVLYGWKLKPTTVSIPGGVVTAVATVPADGVANAAAIPALPAAGAAPWFNMNLVYNSATWDRMRGNTAGVWVQGPGAEGAAVAGAPVRIAGWDGTNTVAPVFCPSSAVITLAGAGTTQLVALSGATRIRICHISLALDAAANVQFIQGTGAACVTGPANVTGNYRGVLSMALGFPQNPLALAAGQALCVTITAANAGGLVQYAQY
jgi:hypothetical protein